MIGEPGAQPRYRLAGQRDLRHQEDNGAPGGQHFFGGAQVDLGLAAAGDAVDEQFAARGDHPARGRERGLLLVAELMAVCCRSGWLARCRRGLRDAHCVDGDEPLQTDERDAGLPAQGRLIADAIVLQQAERRSLARP